jgi:hypothetical protein
VVVVMVFEEERNEGDGVWDWDGDWLWKEADFPCFFAKVWVGAEQGLTINHTCSIEVDLQGN